MGQSSIVPGGRDFERRGVVQPRVRPVVVLDHVGGDHLPSASVPGVIARSAAARWISGIASPARQRVSSWQATISRLQQTGRGHQVDPSGLGDPHAREVEVPELVGALDREEAGLAPSPSGRQGWISPCSRITRSSCT
jgi:hypothetical protein